MGSVRKSPWKSERTGKQKWQARYRDPDGGQRTASFPTKREADAYLIEVEGAKNKGTFVSPDGGRKTYKAWIDEWWPGATNKLRQTTIHRDKEYLDRYAVKRFGSMQLGRIDYPAVATWVTEMLADGLAPATVVKVHQIFGKSMNAAVKHGLLPRSPCDTDYLPKIEPSKITYLNPAQVVTLADCIDERYRALVLVGAYGGLRIGEMVGLRRGRVEITRIEGRVAGAKIEVAEIAVEMNRLMFGPPKTLAGTRTVALPRWVAAELADHLDTHAGKEWVFPGPGGGTLLLHNWRRRVWLPAVKKAGVPDLTPHGLRHTAVAIWIAAGATPVEIAKRAGHTSVSVVLDRYGGLYPEQEQQLLDRLDRIATTAEVLPDATVINLHR